MHAKSLHLFALWQIHKDGHNKAIGRNGPVHKASPQNAIGLKTLLTKTEIFWVGNLSVRPQGFFGLCAQTELMSTPLAPFIAGVGWCCWDLSGETGDDAARWAGPTRTGRSRLIQRGSGFWYKAFLWGNHWLSLSFQVLGSDQILSPNLLLLPVSGCMWAALVDHPAPELTVTTTDAFIQPCFCSGNLSFSSKSSDFPTAPTGMSFILGSDCCLTLPVGPVDGDLDPFWAF